MNPNLNLTSNPTAQALADELRRRNQRLVLAESCTGGMAAALLTQIPGISEFFCGSAVTYRQLTKIAWLGITQSSIERFRAESAEITQAMVQQVLENTPEADLAGAITGHLGPGIDPPFDGVIFVSVGFRVRNRTADCSDPVPIINQIVNQTGRLQSSERISRQQEAAEFLLQGIIEQLRAVG
jgi:nicotinamide-nucleotide amidase